MASEEDLARDATKAENKAIDELNDRFRASVRKTITETDWDDIERRLMAQGQADDVAEAISWQGYNPSDLLEETFWSASEISAANIADVVERGSSFSFELTDPNALKWLEEYGAEEIQYISDSQRDAIKQIVTNGYRDGITYQRQAREIKQLIGLDPRRAEAVQNMRSRLLERGMLSDAKIDRQAARYAEKLLKQRARNIAVQEATTAGARAFYETTADACQRGILDPNIYEGYRIVTGDERLCPKCSALAGEARALPDGAYPSSGGHTPKLHVLCRCVEGVRSITMKKKEMKESGRGFADVIFEAKSLKRKDGIIFCPTVPLVEGVYDGWGMPVLRLYEEFFKDAKWLNGLTVLTNHEALTPDARRVGQLSEILPKPEAKKIAATTQFYELDLTQREIESIMSREPIHGSLGFSCYIDMTAGDYNGTHYEAIERGPYVFYEYSMVRRGVVTPEDGAGFNVEGRNRNHNHQSQSSAPGGADMDIEQMKQAIEEAQKPLMDRLAALEQSNTTLQGELKTMREQAETDKQARVFEAFRALLKPGHQEKAKELFEASQKDPLWITENVDKFVQQAGQERRLQGRAITEGGSAAQTFDLAKEQDKLWGRSV